MPSRLSRRQLFIAASSSLALGGALTTSCGSGKSGKKGGSGTPATSSTPTPEPAFTYDPSKAVDVYVSSDDPRALTIREGSDQVTYYGLKNDDGVVTRIYAVKVESTYEGQAHQVYYQLDEQNRLVSAEVVAGGRLTLEYLSTGETVAEVTSGDGSPNIRQVIPPQTKSRVTSFVNKTTIQRQFTGVASRQENGIRGFSAKVWARGENNIIPVEDALVSVRYVSSSPVAPPVEFPLPRVNGNYYAAIVPLPKYAIEQEKCTNKQKVVKDTIEKFNSADVVVVLSSLAGLACVFVAAPACVTIGIITATTPLVGVGAKHTDVCGVPYNEVPLDINKIGTVTITATHPVYGNVVETVTQSLSDVFASHNTFVLVLPIPSELSKPTYHKQFVGHWDMFYLEHPLSPSPKDKPWGQIHLFESDNEHYKLVNTGDVYSGYVYNGDVPFYGYKDGKYPLYGHVIYYYYTYNRLLNIEEVGSREMSELVPTGSNGSFTFKLGSPEKTVRLSFPTGNTTINMLGIGSMEIEGSHNYLQIYGRRRG